jgi:hypothetical protein
MSLLPFYYFFFSFFSFFIIYLLSPPRCTGFSLTHRIEFPFLLPMRHRRTFARALSHRGGTEEAAPCSASPPCPVVRDAIGVRATSQSRPHPRAQRTEEAGPCSASPPCPRSASPSAPCATSQLRPHPRYTSPSHLPSLAASGQKCGPRVGRRSRRKLLFLAPPCGSCMSRRVSRSFTLGSLSF